MNRRRALYVVLSVLAVFLLGTVVVLSSVTYFLAISPPAYIAEADVPLLDNATRWDAAAHGKVERVQRIIHQTWKTETLPKKWVDISKACRDMMPDYEYMLWTDASSRAFIAEHYPWFLDTFDSYKYPIQRADTIRYFVLHYYGGVYMDLDIGCQKPVDPLLIYPVILPKTIPVGVSNDLMFAEKGHPFMEQTIHNLINWDYNWIINYPTVMFSTGPMFLSAQYSLYSSSHPNTALQDIRILPKALYGKNAKEDEAPHSFFSHFYGSSWHSDDAAFIGFLGNWGKTLMWIGLAVLILGIWLPSKKRRSLRRISGYEVLLPRSSGRWQLLSGRSLFPTSGTSTQLPSPTDDASPTSTNVPILHLPFDDSSAPSTPDLSESDPYAGRVQSPIVEVFQTIRNRVAGFRQAPPDTPIRTGRQRHRRGVLFFLPAILTPGPQDIELEAAPPRRRRSPLRPASQPPPPAYDEKAHLRDLETGLQASASSSSSSAASSSSTPRPNHDSSNTHLIDHN